MIAEIEVSKLITEISELEDQEGFVILENKTPIISPREVNPYKHGQRIFKGRRQPHTPLMMVIEII